MGAMRLICILNVGVATCSDDPQLRNETYIEHFVDKGEYRYAQDFALLYLDLEKGNAFYGDCKGYQYPMMLISDVDNWSEQLLHKRNIIDDIKECHDSTLNEKVTLMHHCLQGYCTVPDLR